MTVTVTAAIVTVITLAQTRIDVLIVRNVSHIEAPLERNYIRGPSAKKCEKLKSYVHASGSLVLRGMATFCSPS
jgi:hypothetical protein